MIEIQINGYYPGKFERVQKFACDVVNHFFPRDLKNPVLINIEYQKNIEGNLEGQCVDFGRHQGIRMIQIDLSRRFIDEDDNFPHSCERMASTLAHELVHAKQFIKRQLSNRMLSKAYAKDPTEEEVTNLPWEVEAYTLEEELFNKYW